MEFMKSMLITIIVMLFFSIGVNLITYALPENARNTVKIFSEASENTYDIDSMTSKLEEGLTQQTQIPVVDIGAIVFYSGNFILDLFLNFIFAIPEMIGFFFNGVMLIMNIENDFIILGIQSFCAVAMFIIYIIELISMLTNIRSGRVV